MKKFEEVVLENQPVLDSVAAWAAELYNSTFSKYFEDIRLLSNRLSQKSRPITDEELELILSSLPLNLFEVSEKLSSLRLSIEVLKLRIKEKSKEISLHSTKGTESKRQEDGDMQVIGDRVLVEAYKSVADRVENEISFCRELIMSAKKIWDARRRTEDANPVSPKDSYNQSSIPDYNVLNKSYIK